MKRGLKYNLYAVLALLAVAWGVDDVVARFRKDPFSTARVDQVYAITNRWNQVEYSIGTPKFPRCVNALFPHPGSWPCWYVKSHDMAYIRGGN